MTLLSAEAVLISALINNQDVAAATSFGICEAHFIGYRDEYLWLQNYLHTYEEQPTKDIFSLAFPGFMFSEHLDVRSAADMVFKGFNRRNLQEAMSDATDLLSIGEEREAFSKLIAAEPRRAATKPRKLLTDTGFLDDWDRDYNYVEVPYRLLQVQTGGIRPGNLWYLAARPGQGKTAHLCNIVKHAVLSGNRVLFYSLEMSEMEVRARFHAAMASHWGIFPEITVNSIRDRSLDRHTYKTFIQEMEERLGNGVLDIHTPREGAVTPSVLAARADEYHLNVVDYIGLMRSDKGNAAVEDWRVAAQISNQLKEVGLSKNTGMLCAAQINREGETGKGAPKVVNLAQSDALGQDGDVVVTMRNLSGVATHFSLEKNRHGESGVPFWSTFDPNRGIYNDLSKEQAETLQMEKDASDE